jgi:hypothetical protein
MTEEQKTAQEKANAPSEGMSSMEMMSQVCGECEDCGSDMWKRWMDQQGQGGCMEMMSRMMSGSTETKAATEEKTVNEDAEKA